MTEEESEKKDSRLDKLKAKLERIGASPQKRFGQNFLLDTNQLDAILRDASITPQDTVLEIGPGTGFLSEGLARAGAAVLSVEIDRKLIHLAREAVAPWPDAEVFEGDILAGKHGLNEEVLARLREIWAKKGQGPLKCISNLPYSISTSFLINLCAQPLPWERGVFMIQKEVADRALAQPGGEEYGALSIAMKLATKNIEIVRTVPPQVFWPRPEVHSAVLAMDFLPQAERLSIPWTSLRRVTQAVFASRRKTLRNSFGNLCPKGDKAMAEKLCATISAPPDERGEKLPPEIFLKAALELEKLSEKPRE